MDFTEVLQAEDAVDSSFRNIKRIQDKFKTRLSKSHNKYANRILLMKKEAIPKETKPINYFDKIPSSIPPPPPLIPIFTSFESSSRSSSSTSSYEAEWPEFHDFESHVRKTAAEASKDSAIAEVVRKADRLRKRYPRALTVK